MLINTVTPTTALNRTLALKAIPITAVTSVICATNNQSADNICDNNQPLQLTVNHKNKVANVVPNAATSAPLPIKFTKSPRKQQNRDATNTQRMRGQEWPDVPDVGKIEESNPEVLAQKILETGRKIEAGKFMPAQQQMDARKNIYCNNNKRYAIHQDNQQQQQQQQHVEHNHLMQQHYYQQQATLPSCKESPKVANFEHRLKSIITSVLNEDQEQRKQQLQHTTSIYSNNNNNNSNMQEQQKQHYITTNNVVSIKRKHQTPHEATTSGGNKLMSNILLQQQTSSTSTNISPYAHNIVTTQKLPQKDVTKSAQQQQQQQHMNATNLSIHHRRRTTITAANLEQYSLQQQQQQKQTNLEFKAPPHVAHISARGEFLPDDYKVEARPPRSNSAHSDNAKPTSYMQTTLMKAGELSRPNSNSSQPDYTQVSPAKIALRRHLSQEKLHQLQHATPVPAQQQQQQQNSFATKTIGDLVNGEIERTLEISHQSIINAVVNKSTVAGQLPFHERTLINTNVQRPERVNVRILDDVGAVATTTTSRHLQQQTINMQQIGNHNNKNNGNLQTLAQAAYNHKLMQASANTVYQQQQQQQQCATNATISPRPYQTVALPRAEIKVGIEAYFNDEHNLQKTQTEQQQQQYFIQQQQKSPIKEHNKMTKDQRLNSTIKFNRYNNVGNPPLEGLAASLQDHMLASRKYKEGQQQEERQRRATILTNYVESTPGMNIPAVSAAAMDHQYNQQQLQQQQQINGNFQQINQIATTGGMQKIENGIKRNSPTTSNQPRPNKIAHYTHEPQKYPHPQQHIYVCNNRNISLQQQQQLQQDETHLINRNKKLQRDSLLETSDLNERLKYNQQQQQQLPIPNQQLHCQQISQSLTIQHMQHHQQLANNRNTPNNVGGRTADDGKIINASCTKPKKSKSKYKKRKKL